MGGLFSLLDRVTSWLPIQTKEERIRNNINKLKKERDELLKIPNNSNFSKRYADIIERLSVEEAKLKNR